LEEEGSGLGAGSAEAFVGLGEFGFEGLELVVVFVYALGEVVRGGLLGGDGDAEKKQCKQAKYVVSHPKRTKRV